ncbi:NYN domain-containing protein [[Phormidium] sp. ETS-05]|uniref:NYN domain-containing protein n=1 Tax=[Phormidium] sp. ETS-05 TaxID=222819 RepID=UPI0018EEF204|nr:NYN domain-containing protein [[Phormidium] sp. ETS-05]
MSDEITLSPAAEAVKVNLISRYLAEAIAATSVQHPEWLQPKYQNLPYGSDKFKVKLMAKLAATLGKAARPEDLLLKVIKICDTFLVPGFLVSADFAMLMGKIGQLIYPEAPQGKNGSKPLLRVNDLNGKGVAEVSPNARGAGSSAIAILLLDAENLQLDAEIEQFLGEICTYPIQIKIAFANWRNMGLKDEDFHRRGYELIHVPAGKDSADVKMATVGSTIFVHYPDAKEVFVCSSDRVLVHLCNTLQTHGFTVYQVRQQGKKITAINSKTGARYVRDSGSPPPIPTADELLAQIKSIITSEQAKGNYWLKLSALSAGYQNQYQLVLEEVIAHHYPSQDIKQVLADNAALVFHQPPSSTEFYVTIFKEQVSEGQEDNNSLSLSEPLKIESRDDLENVLLTVLVDMKKNAASENYFPISNLATEFRNKYGESISDAIKRLNLNLKFITFLQSCNAFYLKKSNGHWAIGLRH